MALRALAGYLVNSPLAEPEQILATINHVDRAVVFTA